MLEQVRGLSQKLGINPLIATALVTDRMQTGPATDSSGEPRMPDSWEPRLRGGGAEGMTQNILDAALLGQRGAAALRATEAQNQGLNQRAQLEADTRKTLMEAQNKAAMDQIAARAAATLEQLKAQGASAQQLATVENKFRQQAQQLDNQFKQEQQAREFAQRDKMGQQDFERQVQGKFIDKQLNPSLPLDVQLEGQQIAAERERLAKMGRMFRQNSFACCRCVKMHSNNGLEAVRRPLLCFQNPSNRYLIFRPS